MQKNTKEQGREKTKRKQQLQNNNFTSPYN